MGKKRPAFLYPSGAVVLVTLLKEKEVLLKRKEREKKDWIWHISKTSTKKKKITFSRTEMSRATSLPGVTFLCGKKRGKEHQH